MRSSAHLFSHTCKTVLLINASLTSVVMLMFDIMSVWFEFYVICDYFFSHRAFKSSVLIFTVK